MILRYFLVLTRRNARRGDQSDGVRSHDEMRAAEVCLLGLTLGSAVLVVEMLAGARAGLHYLDAVRVGGAAFKIGVAYAVLFGATCLAGWLIARLMGRGVARRSPTMFLGLSISSVPVFCAALTIHPAVSSFL